MCIGVHPRMRTAMHMARGTAHYDTWVHPTHHGVQLHLAMCIAVRILGCTPMHIDLQCVCNVQTTSHTANTLQINVHQCATQNAHCVAHRKHAAYNGASLAPGMHTALHTLFFSKRVIRQVKRGEASHLHPKLQGCKSGGKS
eukprot:gene7894-biopygen45